MTNIEYRIQWLLLILAYHFKIKVYNDNMEDTLLCSFNKISQEQTLQSIINSRFHSAGRATEEFTGRELPILSFLQAKRVRNPSFSEDSGYPNIGHRQAGMTKKDILCNYMVYGQPA